MDQPTGYGFGSMCWPRVHSFWFWWLFFVGKGDCPGRTFLGGILKYHVAKAGEVVIITGSFIKFS